MPSVSTVGSIAFEYCSNSPLLTSPCTAPAGFSASSAVLAAQSGETGFTVDAGSTANRIVLTRGPGLTSAIPVSYTFNNIINQSAANSTVYVRVATYATDDGTGPYTDEGSVAYSTASQVSVTAFVPPFLRFCIGITVAPNCTSSSGSYLDFGELRSNQTRSLTSQFAISTNDPAGYVASVLGTTMTSGSNIIPALGASPTSSQVGTSQFGMNLRTNSSPSIGADPIGAGTGTIAPDFAVPNKYYFDEGIVVSSTFPTEYNTFTVSYIINVDAAQKPGVYTTTLTYIAVAAF
jgi:hypothetical protein